ncbi:solute carrier family 26 member 6 [Chanos chanos]|uniref:Solute carrier family 26 member 6 n=1 Tax=Chanos chanos TaxID=29144 RepID=A0A6J2UX48_CHACN|nr:solute carrier family 26 member 6-like [Chanos chanos]
MAACEHVAKGFCVERQVLDELSLDEVAHRRAQSLRPGVKERLQDSLRCSVGRLKSCILTWIPVLSWLPRYSVRDNAMGDFISGVSVGIMHLPQGMAYALLASVPPVIGLYSSFYPVLVYFIFGTSRHISVGTFAVISIMLGGVTERLAPDDLFLKNGTNGSVVIDTVARDEMRIQVAAAATLLSGLFQIGLGMVRFGFVVTYLSEPLVRGYTTGAATHVVISQLKYIFRVKPQRYSGPLSQVFTLIDLCSLLPHTHIPTLIVSVVSLAVLIIVKELNSIYSKKLPLPIPIELFVIIAGTLISHYANLNEFHAVEVVGEIPSGLLPPQVPDLSFFPSVIGDAFAVAIVGYAINISLGKTFALKHGYKVDNNQELIALGLSNTVGGFFRCYSVTSSLSRSLIQESTGGKTQVAGVISSVIVLITMLKLGSLFEDLPKAVLSTIVFVNLKGMFKQYLDIVVLWKSNKVDLLVWLVTCTCTVLLNLDLGLAASIAFTLLTVIFRTQLPRYSLLGWVPGTELYLDKESYEQAKEIPGITIFRSSSMLYYANAELYLDALKEKSGIDVPKLLKQKRKREGKEKRQKEKERKMAEKERKKENGSLHSQAATSYNHATAVTNLGYLHDESIYTNVIENLSDEETEQSDTHSSSCESRQHRTHSIILDCSTVSFIDTVTLKTLQNIFQDFGEVDVTVYMAACQVCVVEQLEKGGFFSEFVPKSRLFPSVHDAVLHCLSHSGKKLPSYESALEMACITKL